MAAFAFVSSMGLLGLTVWMARLRSISDADLAKR
jgi:hypothetical protein